jgi:hypothetical protein
VSNLGSGMSLTDKTGRPAGPKSPMTFTGSTSWEFVARLQSSSSGTSVRD